MAAYLDISDVIHGHPKAEQEYADLLAEVQRYKDYCKSIAVPLDIDQETYDETLRVKMIDQARKIYQDTTGNEQIVIDDDAKLSPVDDQEGISGAWVQAWVWVDYEDLEEKDDGED